MAAPVETEYLLPNHNGPWTLDDVLALPEDHSQRIELIDGTLIVSPLGSVRHQRLVGRAFAAFDRDCPAEFEATVEINVRLSGGRLLIPDFTVIRPGAEGVMLPVEDVLLAGEVLSPSTRINDLVLKRELYAEAGVPFYLMIDPQGPVVTATLLELRGVKYVEVTTSDDGVLTLDRPFPVTISLSA
ncbi:Uma2 family endonuclease [Lentzea tibetensis]|uniref:Uma2 family endonuclease n=1 Tax=Lentzea tibetensis TaxID=2591470 RepID=A0A563ET66_9PSEU|nr:Uma2 family endonuclease [Lentzea tibetensis]TWP50324.1 Uma2 family endonuclease [Lentzea tibetensis]